MKMTVPESLNGLTDGEKRGSKVENEVSVENGINHAKLELNTNSYYRVYKQRWFLLMVAIGSEMLVGFRSWRYPIVNIVYPFWDTNVTEVINWSVLPLVISAILFIPAGRALDRWGVRTMCYVTCPLIVLGNSVQALILFDETNSPIWAPKQYRLGLFVFCNCLLMIKLATFNGLSAKLANDWFPLEETTLALVLPIVMGRLTEASLGFISPRLVSSDKDLRYIGYINIALVLFLALTIVTCVTRSQPKTPPSLNARKSRECKVAPLSTFITVLRIAPFSMAMISYGFNYMSINILKGVYPDTLALHGYSNGFSGILFAIDAVTSCTGSFFATWLDRNYDYIRCSKVASFLFTCSFCLHFASQHLAGFHIFLVISLISMSFSLSVLIPLQLQAMYRPTTGLLPDASVAALNGVIGIVCYVILTVVLNYAKDLERNPNVYLKPYLVYGIIIIIFNGIYCIFYKIPTKPEQPKAEKANHNNPPMTMIIKPTEKA